MTPKVPKWKCSNCAHNKGYCPLEDLEPCSYIPIDKDKRAKDIFLAVVTVIAGIAITAVILFACKEKHEEKVEPKSAVAILRGDSLSKWEKLVMAIAYTESRYNPSSVGTSQDVGILQITPIYVKEINRLNGTDYHHSDAYSMELSLEMFKAMNEAKNPTKDLDLAIYLHNKSPEYKRRVWENYQLIERYETFRKVVKHGI